MKTMTIWQKIKHTLTKLKITVPLGDTQEGSLFMEPSKVAAKTEDLPALASSTDAIHDDSDSKNKYAQSKTSPTIKSKHEVTDIIIQYLNHKKWKFTHFPPKAGATSAMHHLSLGMQGDGMEWAFLFRINEDNKLIAVYGVLPFTLYPEQISAGVALATQINYDLMLGNVEVDIRDGEVRFKNAIDTECTTLDERVLNYLTQSVTAMTHVIYQLFYELHNGKSHLHSLEDLLNHLQQQSHNATFFVPTDSIQ